MEKGKGASTQPPDRKASDASALIVSLESPPKFSRSFLLLRQGAACSVSGTSAFLLLLNSPMVSSKLQRLLPSRPRFARPVKD
jgi:hypothetical protein